MKPQENTNQHGRAGARHPRNTAKQRRNTNKRGRTAAEHQRSTAKHRRNTNKNGCTGAGHTRKTGKQRRTTNANDCVRAEHPRSTAKHRRDTNANDCVRAEHPRNTAKHRRDRNTRNHGQTHTRTDTRAGKTEARKQERTHTNQEFCRARSGPITYCGERLRAAPLIAQGKRRSALFTQISPHHARDIT